MSKRPLQKFLTPRWLTGNTFRVVLVALMMLVGCRGERSQSSLHPAGPAADSIATLWWVMLAVLGGYSLAVFVLTLVAIFRSPSAKPPKRLPTTADRNFIMLGGVILPTLILIPLLVYSLSTTKALRMREGGLTIQVTGHRWWWDVKYPDHQIVMGNELIIPAGEPVRLELTSADVIHSFWVPQLHGKADMIPGRTTEFWLEADRPGVFRGQCAEYCGHQHALMGFEVIVLPQDEFVSWLNEHSQPAPPKLNVDADLEQGQALFFQNGCAVCHKISGTPAEGIAGPDLTTVASRRKLAAATLPNTSENLLAWLADPQSIKPHAKMPATLAEEKDLKKIVLFLESLDGKGGRRGARE